MEKCFKVICTECTSYSFTVNKVYHVINGKLTSDLGGVHGPFKNVYEINRDSVVGTLARFCEYVEKPSYVDYTTYNRVSFHTSSYYNRLNPFEIEDVIFNGPATIVKWVDGTKTVVKAQDGEEFDPEKGLAMAFAKKAMGNKGSYFNVIKKWSEKYEEDKQTEQFAQTMYGLEKGYVDYRTFDNIAGRRVMNNTRGIFVNAPNVIKTSDDE